MGLEQKRHGRYRGLVWAGALTLVLALVAVQWVLRALPDGDDLGRYLGSAMPATGQAQQWGVSVLEAKYVQYRDEGRLGKDEAGVFSDLLAHSRRDGAPVMVIAASGVLLKGCTADDPGLRRDSIAAARELRDALREDPGTGWVEVKQILERHPTVKTLFEELTGRALEVINEASELDERK
ncbi:MAG: hypothetical protein GWP08_07250 [Nitrospiraceae bacterium]|nr:hypothetical protein [Nitrospiraceae bacterium]